MTTQHEDDDIYKYNYDENSYNLISYDMKKVKGKKPEFDVCVYTYEKNKKVENYEKRPFINTKAYDKIKNTREKVLLINNNDLEKTGSNDSKYKNKYFMLINIDGNENGRRYNIIPFNETLKNLNTIENPDIDEIKKVSGGQTIPNTFYIINTYIDDIKKNFESIKRIIKNKELSNTVDKYKEIINPLNNEHYGLIQQIIFILVEKKVNYNIQNPSLDIKGKINELRNYGYYVYEIVSNLIKYLSNEIKKNGMLNYIEENKEIYTISKEGYCKMIYEFKNIVEKLMEFIGKDLKVIGGISKFTDSKVLIYHSIINNQIGRSRNNGLLITHSLLTNEHIDGDYIKVLDSSGYLSYYGLMINRAINITDIKNKEKQKLNNEQIEGYLVGDKYKLNENAKISKDSVFYSIYTVPNENYDMNKTISFNSIKINDKNECINSDNKNSASALYNSYNLHLYGKNFFKNNIKNILCFDADLSEDTGNGRMVYKDSRTNYHDDKTYLTIYGKMNPHYMPPIIQIFKDKNNDYILAVSEDEKLNKWVDITRYNNIIKEIFHKHFIIIHIKFEDDDLYIYYKKIHISYYNDIINKLFKILDSQNNKYILYDNLFEIKSDHIYYKNYKVDIYLGFNLYNNKDDKYYNYIYNLTNYKLNYILKNISKDEYYKYEISEGEKIDIIRFSNYANKRISTVNGYYLLYNDTKNITGKEIIEKFKNIVFADYNHDKNKDNYTLLKSKNKDLYIKPYIITIKGENITTKGKNTRPYNITTKGNITTNDNITTKDKNFTTLKNILNIYTIEQELKKVIVTDPFDKYYHGFVQGYSKNYYKGYYDEGQTTENEDKKNYDKQYKDDNYYLTGYKRGKDFGYNHGEEDFLNKIDANSKCYLKRGEVYKLYLDAFKNNINY